MKSHFSESSNDAGGHLETADEACLRDHRLTATTESSELIATVAAVIALLAVAGLLAGDDPASQGRTSIAQVPWPHWHVATRSRTTVGDPTFELFQEERYPRPVDRDDKM